MKKSLFRNLGIALMAVITFAACKKTVDGDGPVNPSAKRLIKAEISAGEYTVYDYNTDGMLSKVTDFENGSATGAFTLTYGNDKKLTEANYSGSGKLRFVYNGDNIDTMKIYSETGEYGAFIKYLYEGNRNVQQSYFYGDGTEFHEMQRVKFSFSANGNVSSQSVEILNLMSGQWMVNEKTVFTRFDSKINPLSLPGLSILGKIFGIVHQNNIEEQNFYEAANTLAETRQSTYTYDGEGFPLTVTEKIITTGSETTQTTKFIYNQ